MPVISNLIEPVNLHYKTEDGKETSLVAILADLSASGMRMISFLGAPLADRFSTLEPERAELSRLLLAAPDRFRLRPLDRFDREYPAVWFGIDRESGTPALGIFNFAETSMRLQVTLPDAPAGTLRNLWGNETLKWVSGAPCEFQVEPHNCLLFLLSCSIRNYPTISKVKAEKCLL